MGDEPAEEIDPCQVGHDLIGHDHAWREYGEFIEEFCGGGEAGDGKAALREHGAEDGEDIGVVVDGVDALSGFCGLFGFRGGLCGGFRREWPGS